MCKKLLVAMCIAMSLLVTACAHKPPTFKGVAISELYRAMDPQYVVLLNGNSKHDAQYFYQTLPSYYALKYDATVERKSIEYVRADNFVIESQEYVQSLGINEYWLFLRQNNFLARVGQTDRPLELGFCKDPTKVDTGHNYFYCFEYSGTIYRVTTKVDVIDRTTGKVRRAWVYSPYKQGEFSRYFVVGPYGLLPKPVIAGMWFQPHVYID